MSCHEIHMAAALGEARKALAAGDFPVGCVLTVGSEILSTGYRINSRAGGNEVDHAEIIAVHRLAYRDTPIDFSRVTAYSTMEPCLMCFATLILSGIRTIVYAYEDVMGGGTGIERACLPPLFAGMEMTIIPGVCRTESLDLFKTFFRGEDNDYWRDSLLARYTLDQ